SLVTGAEADALLARSLESLRADLARHDRRAGAAAASWVARDGEEISGVVRAGSVVFPKDVTVFVRGDLDIRSAGSVLIASRLVFLRRGSSRSLPSRGRGSDGAPGESISIQAEGDVTVDVAMMAGDGAAGEDLASTAA